MKVRTEPSPLPGLAGEHVKTLWYRTLKRRSQRDKTTWERLKTLADEWLLEPRILHPWPSDRFAVKHPR